jgi:flagellar basal-body rod protein FlgC
MPSSNVSMNIFDVAGSAMSAQSQRMNVTASNLANADSVSGPDGQPYRAKQVVFAVAGGDQQDPSAAVGGVQVAGVVEDQSPLKMVYDPKHPLANSAGYVAMPNVNVVEEMVNMISASRSYQANVEVLNTAKTMMLKTLTIGQ